MDLLLIQNKFAVEVANLILMAVSMGFQVALGDTCHDSRCTYGPSIGKHRQGIAIDLYLYKDGKPVLKKSEMAILGKLWEIRGGVWGGNFGGATNPEAQEINHFEWLYIERDYHGT